jgi:hypothetical protein
MGGAFTKPNNVVSIVHPMFEASMPRMDGKVVVFRRHPHSISVLGTLSKDTATRMHGPAVPPELASPDLTLLSVQVVAVTGCTTGTG